MKKYILKSSLVIIFCLSATGVFNSCTKENDCFDKDLYEAHKNDVCPQNCPGVTGCDGATYCNECEANKRGIHIGR